MEIQIKHRFTGAVVFSHTTPGNTMKVTALAAIAAKINLSGADLNWASLRGANLSGADLSGADLSEADLSEADLNWADLSGADLSGAGLSGASLRGANLSGADLSGADLSEADLSEADLSRADLRSIKHDIWGVLLYNRAEVAAHLEQLKAGRVNGRLYKGECACLVGSLCNLRGIDAELPDSVIGMPKNAHSLAERWYMGIWPGDTPQTSPIVALTVDWINEFITLTQP
jgi:uncharacterized protein YjbI with pentapeptide repeats